MKMIVGLGNPGPRYETTRHNVGFLALDQMIEEWKAVAVKPKFGGELYEAELANEKLLLVKPQTFMNLSGKCVGPMLHYFKLSANDLLVIHDEVDLPAQSIRIKTGGGSGGHNGIKSIDQHIGASIAYHRIRIGIGRPGQPGIISHAHDLVDFVTEPFSDSELSALDSVFKKVTGATALILGGKVSEAMNEFNRG